MIDGFPMRGENPDLPESNPMPEIISSRAWRVLWLYEAQGKTLEDIRREFNFRSIEGPRQMIRRTRVKIAEANQ